MDDEGLEAHTPENKRKEEQNWVRGLSNRFALVPMMEEQPAQADEGRRDLEQDEGRPRSHCKILLPEGRIIVSESDHVM